jgi:LysR family transcriptional regulator, glycine cleavage system transcriptional activator
MPSFRIPPIQSLQAFEALARIKSVTAVSNELNVTASAISHRINQLETQLGLKLFENSNFELSSKGKLYLKRVKQALVILQDTFDEKEKFRYKRLRVAVTPTFSRQILLRALSEFRSAYPEIDLVLQVSIPMQNIMPEKADVEIRYGLGPFTDVESMHLLSDIVSPVCSPIYFEKMRLRGDFSDPALILKAKLIRCPLEPWRTWFSAYEIPEPAFEVGSQFNDIGLVLDAAVAGFGVALMRLRLGRSWLESERLLRLSKYSVASPFHYYVCWRRNGLENPETAAFVSWLVGAIKQIE